jgi:hypothetical protein
MTYMLLIVEKPGDRAEAGRALGEERYARMGAFAGELKARGLLSAVESLRSTDAAVRISGRDGPTSALDGPFAEAKEMIGGFFLLDCDDRDTALAIARACPAVEWATVELRETGPCFL